LHKTKINVAQYVSILHNGVDKKTIQKKQELIVYYILVQYFYYSGTFYAPENGPLLHEGCEGPILFDSIDDAKAYLKELGVDYEHSAQTLSTSGIYYLAHGEYSSPLYKIRKKKA